jgi:hypothetical protein
VRAESLPQRGTGRDTRSIVARQWAVNGTFWPHRVMAVWT